MQAGPVVEVDRVSKKYCRQLKRALWYGLRDLSDVLRLSNGHERLQARPGEFFAVRDATFRVDAGECVSMLGPNGAGKSTMLKLLNGLIRPDGGTIRIRGRVGALIELGAGFNPVLSGRENVFINGAVLGLSQAEIQRRFDDIVDFAGLADVIDTPVQTYSSGMRVRLGFAVAAHVRPRLLLVDEVLAVGDVGFRLKCVDRLQRLAHEGTSIILVTHAVNMLARLTERAIVFDRGRVHFDGDLQRGIAMYEQLMDVRQELREEKSCQGVEGARIQSVEVLDETGTARHEFGSGETVRLRIALAVEQPLANARLVVSLQSPSSGVISSMTTAASGYPIDLRPPGGSVELKLHRIPLMVGAYHLVISLYGGRAEFYHRRHGLGEFLIVAPDANASHGINGIVRLEHSWETARE
jgi:lipopolysaccharide transport system ATP-binding protein